MLLLNKWINTTYTMNGQYQYVLLNILNLSLSISRLYYSYTWLRWPIKTPVLWINFLHAKGGKKNSLIPTLSVLSVIHTNYQSWQLIKCQFIDKLQNQIPWPKYRHKKKRKENAHIWIWIIGVHINQITY